MSDFVLGMETTTVSPDETRVENHSIMEESVVVLQPGVELAVKRSHEEVWDRKTGDWLTLEVFFRARDYGRIIQEGRVQLELELLEGSPRYVCPHCKDAMVIRSKAIRERSVRRFFFEHVSRHGRETCAGKKGQSEKVILARKFGQHKEGALHLAFKQWIQECLDADSEFSGTSLETRWWDMDGVRWRQPDVQSIHRGQRVAIEVQLSTTFIHVIAERMKFYRENEGRLLWLFKDLDLAAFRLSEDDIFYANNRNAFRISSATLERSKKEGRFVLECLWLEPQVDGEDQECHGEVFFDQLQFDAKNGIPRCYWSDYDSKEAKVRSERARLAEERKWAPLRQDFEDFYVAMLRGEWNDDYDERDRQWATVCRSFAQAGIRLPQHPHGNDALEHLLIAAYSVKAGAGKPIGTGHGTLAELGHYLIHQRPYALWLFRWMLLAHAQVPMVRRQDRTGNFQGKMDKCLESWADGDALYEPDQTWNELLAVLFPEVASDLVRDPVKVARAVLERKRATSVL